MAQPTILALPTVTVTSNGGHAGDVLFELAAVIAQAQLHNTYHETDPTPTTVVGTKAAPIFFPGPTIATGTKVLVIPASDQGVISVGAGWTDVIYNGTGQLFTGPNENVLGDLNLGGPKVAVGTATVVASGGGTTTPVPEFGANGAQATIGLAGQINDSAPGALLAFTSGNYNATSSGAGSNVVVNNTAQIQLDLAGDNSTLELGNSGSTLPAQQRWFDNVTIAGASDSVTMNPHFNAVFNVASTASNTSITFGGTNATDNVLMALNGAGTTIMGYAGNLNIDNVSGTGLVYNGTGAKAQIYDTVGGSMITTGSQGDIYENAAGGATTTIIGGVGGNDTVYAFTGVDYHGHAATDTFFVGSTSSTSGANTINAGANATIYGGAAGGTYTIGGGSFFFQAAQGSAGNIVQDNIVQSGGSAAGFMYSFTDEQITLTSLAGGGAAKGDTLFAAGSNTIIDASGSAGGNSILIDSEANGSGSLPSAVTGTSTLVGSSAGHEAFTLFIDNSTEAAHTITISNYQSSDTFVVSNVVGAGAFLAADTNAINAFNAGTGSSFTLQDGTTVTFTGPNIPHNVQMN